MNRIHEDLLAILRTLNAAEIPYALCGGLALAVYGVARATEDIDLLVLNDDVARIQEVVKPLGYRFPTGEIPFNVGTPNRQSLYLISKFEGDQFRVLDLIAVNDPLREAWESREKRQMSGLEIWVLSKAGLIRMKSLSQRSQDAADIVRLYEEDSDE